MEQKNFQIQYEFHDSLPSTNNYVKEAAARGAKEGLVVIAKKQTAGKGRLGKSFFSPEGSGLYLSLLLRPAFPPKESTSITTCAAVAVARAIEGLLKEPVQIKWVNDIYHNNRKLCGILTEAACSDEFTMDYAVLGIGINLTEPKHGFPEDLQQKATALYPYGTMPDDVPMKLAAEILRLFQAYYPELTSHSYMQEYRSRSMLTGRDVTFNYKGENCSGMVTGIDDEAHLLVTMKNGTILELSSGEVSVTPA